MIKGMPGARPNIKMQLFAKILRQGRRGRSALKIAAGAAAIRKGVLISRPACSEFVSLKDRRDARLFVRQRNYNAQIITFRKKTEDDVYVSARYKFP